MTNNYWTKTKLPTAVNQAIYEVIFHWVPGTSYLILFILQIDLCKSFSERGVTSLVRSDQSC